VELPSPVLLVAEDDPTIQQLLQELLEDEGYTVLLTGDGSHVLSQLHNTRIDLLLLDVKIPGLNGLELCQRIREQELLGQPHQCIILLTAATGDDELIACGTAGADDFIIKPFDITDLLARIRSVIIKCNEPMSDRVLELA
jgi:DNA-binding response OmpR family regulator